MNAFRIPAIVAVLALFASPVLAGKMTLRAAAGQSINEFGHGTVLEADLLGQVTPWLAIGVETGVCYLRTRPLSIRTASGSTEVGAIIGGYTDGVTRNRAYFLGPEIRVGQVLYGVVSAGVYDVGRDDQSTSGALGGSSVGIGLIGSGRFRPVAEVRYRSVGRREDGALVFPAFAPAPIPLSNGSSTTFTFGVSFR